MEQSRILQLLEDMSLEEKINQLFQPHAGFYEEGGIATGPVTEQGFSTESVEQAGSVLSVVGAAKIKQIQKQHMEKHPHHIPLLFMADIINGYKTIFPIPLAQGAAFNPEVAKTGAQVAALEASTAGLHVTFSPMLDLARDARWGRVMESNGEDPYLNSTYARALIEGYQGDDPAAPGKLGACVKHFAAYGAPVAGRDYNNVELSERSLREDYLPAYAAAIEAGALLVMTSFNTLNRIPSTANKWLMRQILRGEMGFDGVLISDWAAIEEVMNHNLAKDRKEAARLAIEAGTDIDMMTTCYTNYLKELITEGEVSEKLLDEAVLRVLELKNKLGLFENPYKDADQEAEKRVLLCSEHRQAARQAASETFVLLENDGMLPLQKEEKVAFIGPYVEEKGILGAWSIFGDQKDAVSIREGVEARKVTATFEKGSEILGPCDYLPGVQQASTDTLSEDMQQADAMIERAVAVAKEADKAVLCLGEHTVHSGEGASRANLDLPEIQRTLLRRVAAVNPNVSVVLFTGRPLDLREVKALAKAVLVVWMPGSEGGNAIADVLYGTVSPSGKLPMSFPYCVGQVPIFYSQFQTGRFYDGTQPDQRFVSRYLDAPNEPLYPFGYGLSYSTFQYGDVKIEQKENRKVSVKVKNTGTVKAAEVVQMYIRDDKASVVRPVRELKGYQKIWLEPGQEQEVSFVITEDMLKFYDSNMEYKAEPGSFTVYVGSDSRTENKAVFERKKLVALTFDDGPNTSTTHAVLDKLEKYQVKATFFLIGDHISEDTVPVIKRELALGCEVENHSWTHSFMDKMPADVIEKEIRDTSAKIAEITGREPQFFRPPYIAVNDMMYEVIDMPFICGQGVEDWLPEVSAKERARRVLEQTVDGSIILLHDMEGNDSTVEALKLIIPELQKRGFEFVTVSELFKEKQVPAQKNPGEIYSIIQ